MVLRPSPHGVVAVGAAARRLERAKQLGAPVLQQGAAAQQARLAAMLAERYNSMARPQQRGLFPTAPPRCHSSNADMNPPGQAQQAQQACHCCTPTHPLLHLGQRAPSSAAPRSAGQSHRRTCPQSAPGSWRWTGWCRGRCSPPPGTPQPSAPGAMDYQVLGRRVSGLLGMAGRAEARHAIDSICDQTGRQQLLVAKRA